MSIAHQAFDDVTSGAQHMLIFAQRRAQVGIFPRLDAAIGEVGRDHAAAFRYLS